jgi:hypothetical protein
MRHAPKNAVSEKVALIAGAVSDDIPLPEGVILRSEAEMVIWGQFTRARTRGDWRDHDLILIAKAVRIEADIRKHQESLDSTGPLIRNPKGTSIANPLLNVIDSLQRMQLAVIRSLSLSQTGQDPRDMNDKGRAQQGYSKLLNELDDLIPGIKQ